jgi:hypothetical protein
MTGSIRLATALAALLVPAALTAQSAPPGGSSDLDLQLARIRAATDAFHDTAAARAAGYPSTEHCMESAAGGMGHHFMNRSLLDDRLEVERPEILVYAPTKAGSLKLAGVEYVVPYSAWDRTEPPRILGHDLKRSDELGIWYVHVWVWEENAKGLFADWNPAVKCSP